MLELATRELELKERSLQLQEILLNASDEPDSNGTTLNQVQSCNDEKMFDNTNLSYPASQNTSCWLQLHKSGLNVESHHFVNAEKGANLLVFIIVTTMAS